MMNVLVTVPTSTKKNNNNNRGNSVLKSEENVAKRSSVVAPPGKSGKKLPTVGRCFGLEEDNRRRKTSSVARRDSPRSFEVSGQLTPAKKRSSLARPVRVHDSFVQPKISVIHEEQVPTGSRRVVQRQSNSQDSGTTVCDDPIDDVNSWPIRLRLEEMLEMTISRGKRSRHIRTRKRKKMMLTSKYGHFKDTERLLKVLSVNNVDQDNRYNVKQCSVM